MSVAKIRNVRGNRDYHISNVKFAIPVTYPTKVDFQNYVKKHGIDTVINVSDYSIPKEVVQFYKRCGVKNVIYAPFQDKILEPKEYKPQLQLIETIYQKTHNCGNMLVHCSAGINRSATVISYIAHKTTGLEMGYIIQKIRESNAEQRNIAALTNYTFVNLLRNYVAKY